MALMLNSIVVVCTLFFIGWLFRKEEPVVEQVRTDDATDTSVSAIVNELSRTMTFRKQRIETLRALRIPLPHKLSDRNLRRTLRWYFDKHCDAA